MLGFIARRLGFAVVTVLVSSILVFILVHLSPTTPGVVALGNTGTPETIRAYNESIGWFDPWPVQYWRWLSGMVQGNFGQALTDHRLIAPDLAKRLPVTFTLAALTTVFSAVVGIVLGVTAAVRRGVWNKVVTALSGVLISMPQFWLGILLVYGFAVVLRILPATGYTTPGQDPKKWILGLILPVVALSVGAIGFLARQTRASMTEALAQEHIRTLRAIGTPTWRILYVHALRYASLPVVAGISIQFIGLMGGSVIIEQVFGLPGLGLAMQQAVGYSDAPYVQAVVVIATLVVVVVNFALEMVSRFLDPKLRAA